MRTSYLIAGAVVVALILAKRAKAAQAPSQAQVGSLHEDPILDGTNWTSHLWDRLSNAGDLKDKTAPNVSGTASADFPSGMLPAVNLNAGWNGAPA